jgi:hypothetical protein
MRTPVLAAAALALGGLTLAAAPGAGAAVAAEDGFTVAVYGDSPYGLRNSDTSQTDLTPAFISTVNADPDVSLVMHAGDIHSGKQFCTTAYDSTIASLWTGFTDPLVYTPGDNEWADCHKTGEGGGKFNATTGAVDFVANGSFAQGNPADNLALVRSTFFGRPGTTLGSGTLKVTSQATAYDRRFPTDRQFVENVRWEKGDVVFVTLNIPGGSNNDTDTWYGTPAKSQAQLDDIAQRTAADLRWLDAAFGHARAERARGVVIMEQADMWDLDGNPADHLAGYEPFVAAVAADTTAFRRPVLLVNGDSHRYRSDNPFSTSTLCVTESPAGEVPCTDNLGLHPGYTVPNFHRIVVHGSTSPLEWVKLTVDEHADAPAGTNAFGPFSWTRISTGLVGAS